MLRAICLVVAGLVSLGQGAWAACQGQDLRPTLTGEEQQSVARFVDTVPYATGNHWRAERDGQVIHLIGTIHIDHPGLDAPIAHLRPVIEGAGHLLVEADRAAEKALETAAVSQPDLILMPDTSLPDMMSEASWQALATALRARGMPPFLAARFRPWYVSILLSLPPCLGLDDVAKEQGMDKRLMSLAEGADVPVSALEPFDTVLRLFSSVPMEQQIALIEAALVAPSVGEDLLATITGAYLDEASAQGWALSQVLAKRYGGLPDDTLAEVYQVLQAQLLDARNKAWIPVILGHLDAQPIVVAFGAAHLFGETGVLKLLEDEGFAITRLPFRAP